MALLLAQPSHARCNLTGIANPLTQKDTVIPLRFGHVNLAPPPLQHDGELLARIAVPPTDFTWMGAQADSVLWECDKQDLVAGEVYFMVATNADYPFGGMLEVGLNDGLTGVYATLFRNVGLRLSMKGVTLAREWRYLPVEDFLPYLERQKNGNMKERIAIRLRDVPVMEAELYKVSDNKGPLILSSKRTSRAVIEPNGYIQLVGPGLPHDKLDTTTYRFYRAKNGLAYGMYNGVTSVSLAPTCVAATVTPHVNFNVITVQALDAGGRGVTAPFTIEVDCNDIPGDVTDISGTQENKTALGLQVSTGAFSAAQKLALVNADGGVKYLLSDQYGTDSTLAKGVGISVYGGDGLQRWLVGQPGTVGTGYPRGENAGWYPVLQGASRSEGPLDTKRYRLSLIARLVKLPQQDISPGKVRATMHVLVKVQ